MPETRHLAQLNISGTHDPETQFRATLLHLAGRKGHLAVVKVLLEYGANPEARARMGWTPLYLALESGHDGISCIIFRQISYPEDYLIDLERKLTPLHVASQFGRWNSARYFLENGADIDARDSSGRTPLHHALLYACSENILKTIVVLLEFGPDIDLEGEGMFSWSEKVTARELGTCHSNQKVKALFEGGVSYMPIRLQIGGTWTLSSSSGISDRGVYGRELGR